MLEAETPSTLGTISNMNDNAIAAARRNFGITADTKAKSGNLNRKGKKNEPLL